MGTGGRRSVTPHALPAHRARYHAEGKHRGRHADDVAALVIFMLAAMGVALLRFRTTLD